MSTTCYLDGPPPLAKESVSATGSGAKLPRTLAPISLYGTLAACAAVIYA
jgi:hypothetical protein